MTINRAYLFLTFLVIAVSGNPAMGVLGNETVYIGTLLIFIVLWWLKPLRIMKQDWMIFVLFALLMLVHVLVFGSIVVPSSLGFLIKLGIALLVVRLIPEFSVRYINVMYALSLIGLIFWILTIAGVNMQGLFSELRVPLEGNNFHIGIHNLKEEYEVGVRNMGMFWEPGAFAGYLVLALFFMVRDGRNKGIKLKHIFVLIAALLSTQSTTGYLAFMVLALFYVYSAKLIKGKIAKLLGFPAIFLVLVAGTYMATNQVSFLGEKINAQIESTSVRDDASKINRFGNFMYDLESIAKRPVFGWSANPVTRLSVDPEIIELVAGQGNGFSGFAVRFGFIGFLVFFGFFAHTTRRITGSLVASLFGIVIVCVLLNGEQFLNFPIFLSLIFFPKNKSKLLSLSPGLDSCKSILVGSRVDFKS